LGLKLREALKEVLVGWGHRKEAEILNELGLDVVIEGETVHHGEYPVEEPTSLGGTNGQLFHLHVLLAGDVLVGQLNDKVVEVLSECLEVGAHWVDIEVVHDVISIGGNLVDELIGVGDLAIASGLGIILVDLGSEGETQKGFPWLIVSGSDTVNSVSFTNAVFLVEVFKSSVGYKGNWGNSHQRDNWLHF